MTGRTRRIGPLATALRVMVAVGLLFLAGGAGGLSWGVEWYGLVALPGLRAHRRPRGRQRIRRARRPIAAHE
jgi:hypothetical protein